VKIAFIGGGNMGEAMLAAVLEKKLSAVAGVTVSDVKSERRDYLKNRYGVAVTASNKEAVVGKDVIVLAIKPQNLAEVMAELKGSLKPAQLVLSILAGTRLTTIGQGLAHERIVRVMPNTPARVGAGISAWTATPAVTEKQREQARQILGAMGREIYFDDEKYLDMATAVSGSGPAYFFLMAESLAEAASDIGLSQDAAAMLVLETMLGAARLLQESGQAPAELRRNVTSPGGTTAAAIDVLEKGGFAGLVADAVRAAYRRAQELGK
jgi:pyrroline-5-carboxylate reductase